MTEEALGVPTDVDPVARFEGMGENELLGYLLHLPTWEYAKVRKAASRHLGVTVGALDEKLAAMRSELGGKSGVVEKDMEALAASAGEIIECDDILGLFDADWSRLIAGERRTGRLLLLAGTSRLLDEPMHIAVKGSSSGGKSQVRKTALKFFSPESVISFTSLSEKSLIYEERDFEHKILSMGEASATDAQEFQDMLLRELMSEHRLEHKTVVMQGDRPVTVTIVKNGPVAFMVTTTKLKLHPENETRLLSLDVDDSETQTRAVLLKIAENRSGSAGQVDFRPWQDFQRWLEMGERHVSVPYLSVLAAAIPPKSVRLRRDFNQVLTAIEAHALLHRHQRQRDERDAIVADIEHDYTAVRELMHDLLCEGSEVGVKETVKETVAAVEKLTRGLDENEGVNAVIVGKELKLDKSAARRRLGDAVMAGLVVNLETRKGQPGKYRPTGDLVEAEDMMPTAERLAEMHVPCGPLPPVPPCHPTRKANTDQQPSGGTVGGNGICHRDEPQAVANRSATAIATAETPEKLPNTEARWHGGSGGNGGGRNEDTNDELRADPDDPSTYLDDSNYPLSPETREANRVLGDIPSDFDRRPSRIAKSST